MALKHFWIPSFVVPDAHRDLVALLNKQRRAEKIFVRARPETILEQIHCASREKRLAHKVTVMEAILMKALGLISATALFLFLGTIHPAFAQDEHHEPEAKQAQHEEQAKPAQHEEQAKPAKQEERAKPEKQEAQAKPAQQEKQAKPEKQQAQAKSEKQPQAKPVKQAAHNNGGGHPQRTAAEVQRQHAVPALRLSARGSGRIPDDRFRANFGQGHTFVIREPVMVDGYSRFQYGGFWFGFVNPWPAEWYYTDDVYVDYIDGGYYLCNPYYPGARVSISVVI